MKLFADYLYKSLCRKNEVKWDGRNPEELLLSPPVLYTPGMRYHDGMIYVGRAGDLPAPGREISCLIVSIGGPIPSHWHGGKSTVFTIGDGSDLFTVFNILQETFTAFQVWHDRLQEILDTTADYEEMLRLTARLLNRTIILTDSSLDSVFSDENQDTVPLNKVKDFAAFHINNMKQREPFLFRAGNISVYCENIYVQDEYLGALSVELSETPLTRGEKQIIGLLTRFIRKAVNRKSRMGGGNLRTLRSYLEDLLNCYPVNRDKLQGALARTGEEGLRWICAAAEPSKAMQAIPKEYLCSQVMEKYEGGYAIAQDSCIAFFFQVRENLPERLSALKDVLAEIDLYAGLSVPFEDVMQARDYYRQALVALMQAKELGYPDRYIRFTDVALRYMLQNCRGELSDQLLVSPALQELKKNPDLWNTLKVYLENETNASRTARDLYVHRTSLLKRLSRIESSLDLSTPESRLYMRICICLLEEA